jgi:hypothetical protein
MQDLLNAMQQALPPLPGEGDMESLLGGDLGNEPE